LQRPKKVDSTEKPPKELKSELTVERPKMTAPEWNDYVIDQLRPDEKDPKGNPNIDGLRRLVEDLLGDIVHSAPGEHFEGATQGNGMRATVSHYLKIRWGGDKDDVRVFGAVADVYSGNTDEEYARYPSATADTRAEARALRKALRLRKVVASEELTSLPVTESGIGQFIVNSQIRGINKMCKDLDIDVIKFLNSGTHQYKHHTHIKFTTGQQILEQLNKYLQKMNTIPGDIKGFDADWQKQGEE
jgi:hypothetical protein